MISKLQEFEVGLEGRNKRKLVVDIEILAISGRTAFQSGDGPETGGHAYDTMRCGQFQRDTYSLLWRDPIPIPYERPTTRSVMLVEALRGHTRLVLI